MLGDVIDWLGEACSSRDKRAEPTFSAPRAGLCNYLHQRIQPKYCTQNPELVPRKGGQREGHRPRHNQSEHQPIIQHTCTLNMASNNRKKNIEGKKKKKGQTEKRNTQYVLMMVLTLKMLDKMNNASKMFNIYNPSKSRVQLILCCAHISSLNHMNNAEQFNIDSVNLVQWTESLLFEHVHEGIYH